MKTRPLRNAILIEAAVVVGNQRALHVVVGQRLEMARVADAIAVGNRILLQRFAPSEPGFDERGFVVQRRPLGAVDDDRFEFFRAENRSAAVRCGMIVIVAQHRRVDHVLAGGSDAHDLGVLDPDFGTQQIFSIARTSAPEFICGTQFGFPIIDEEISRLLCRALDNDSVIAGLLEIRRPVAARRAAAERVICHRAQKYRAYFRSTGRKTRPG